MNVDLITNDINVEFYFNPIDIHKSEDDIKSLYYNKTGTIIIIVTKTNEMKIFDFLSKSVLFSVSYFKQMEFTSNIIFYNILVNYLTWSSNSETIYVTCETKNDGTFIEIINFNFNNIGNFYTVAEEDLNIIEINLKKNKIKECVLYTDNFLLISGDFPIIHNITTGINLEFFNNKQENDKNNYTFMIKETVETNSFFLFVKELYLILLIKENNSNNLVKSKYLIEHIEEKNLNDEQENLYYWILTNLNRNYILVDIFGLNTNGEIISVQLNSIKTLILINSTDRILRLFKYDFDSIVMLKDYFDSVNKKKWINAYFYTFKIKNSFQDLIVSALSDVNSLEFIFIDIETGNFIKRLEPFKYQCTDFVCHYTNHFTLILQSYKKIYSIYGYLVNNWGVFAPQLKYVQENVEFIEDEAFFDTFNKNLKKKLIMNQNENKNSVKNIFSSKNQIKRQNLFFKYSPKDDLLAVQSEKDLRDVFQHFNEIMELQRK